MIVLMKNENAILDYLIEIFPEETTIEQLSEDLDIEGSAVYKAIYSLIKKNVVKKRRIPREGRDTPRLRIGLVEEIQK